MPPIATDENFSERILDGLRRRMPGLDVVRVQDALGHDIEDPVALAWAASENRVLVTHDNATMPDFVYDRIAVGAPVPGVIIMEQDIGIGLAIEELTLLLEVGEPRDFRDLVRRIPLRF